MYQLQDLTVREYLALDRASEREPEMWNYHACSAADELELLSLEARFPVAAVYEQTTVPEVSEEAIHEEER